MCVFCFRFEVSPQRGREDGGVQQRGGDSGGDRLVPAGLIPSMVALWHQLHTPADVGGGNHGEIHEVKPETH